MCIVSSGAIFYGADKFEVEVRNNTMIGRGNIEHPFKGNDPPTNERIVETSQGTWTVVQYYFSDVLYTPTPS